MAPASRAFLEADQVIAPIGAGLSEVHRAKDTNEVDMNASPVAPIDLN